MWTTTIGLALICGFFALWPIHLLIRKKHEQTVNAQDGLDLAPGEVRIMQMFVRTSDFLFRGFLMTGSAYHGKLVLTSSRLVYTTYDEKRIGATFVPRQILGIKTGRHGFPVKFPSLALSFMSVSGSARTEATWTRQGFAIGGPGAMITDTGESATVEEFTTKLNEWRTATAN